MTPMEMLREFQAQTGPETIELRRRLLAEEVREADDELRWLQLNTGSMRDTAKELADLVYVAYGTAVHLGIDLDAVLREVHRSNMSKFPATVRDDGKVLKGPSYTPPDLSFVDEP